jgi:hypothetical protein
MGTKVTGIFLALLISFLFIFGCSKPEDKSLWKRKCATCHDGKTVLNEKVVMDREQIKAKFKTLDEFVLACEEAPSCMNILKHKGELLRDVGKEIGIGDTPGK